MYFVVPEDVQIQKNNRYESAFQIIKFNNAISAKQGGIVWSDCEPMWLFIERKLKK